MPEVTATGGGYSDCWKLQWVAGKACSKTENTLFILIVIFPIQLQQTETLDRKLCILQPGFVGEENKVKFIENVQKAVTLQGGEYCMKIFHGVVVEGAERILKRE